MLPQTGVKQASGTDQLAEAMPKVALFYTRIPTPLGSMLLAARAGGLAGAWFDQDQAWLPTMDASWLLTPGHPLLTHAVRELTEYFAKARTHFTLPLAPQGTPFQQKVWESLCSIPYGHTVSYAHIAKSVNTASARATGGAIGRNSLSIFIPCHRVIGSQGKLTGYAGGLHRKQALLDLENLSKNSPHYSGSPHIAFPLS